MTNKSNVMVKAQLKRNMEEYERIAKIKEELDTQMSAIREDICKELKTLGETTAESTFAKFRIVEAHQKVKINSKKLKESFPNVYKLVVGVSNVKESLRVDKK